jgi:hypothetical protein
MAVVSHLSWEILELSSEKNLSYDSAILKALCFVLPERRRTAEMAVLVVVCVILTGCTLLSQIYNTLSCSSDGEGSTINAGVS